MRKVKYYIERHEDGTYWGSSQNIPGVVSSYGSSLSELKKNLNSAYRDYYELAVELKEDYVDELSEAPESVYKLDLQSVFELLPEIKVSNIAEKADMNPSL